MTQPTASPTLDTLFKRVLSRRPDALALVDPAIDAMIAALLEARDHTDFVLAVRALDRALIAGFYTIPLFNVSDQWIARWNRIERPEATSLSGYLPETWWSKGQPQAGQAK